MQRLMILGWMQHQQQHQQTQAHSRHGSLDQILKKKVSVESQVTDTKKKKPGSCSYRSCSFYSANSRTLPRPMAMRHWI